MITFKQFLNESPTDLKAMLKKDCAPFLKLEGGRGGLLYRGIRRIKADALEIPNPKDKDESITYYRKEVRTNRNPSDNLHDIHDSLDFWFKDMFGFSARKNAVFSFGSAGFKEAALYGDRYTIFPIGEVKFVWSPKVDDLYKLTGETAFIREFQRAKAKGKENDFVTEFLSTRGYTDKNLHAAMASGNEIMIQCSHYYAFDASYSKLLAELVDTIAPNHDDVDDDGWP